MPTRVMVRIKGKPCELEANSRSALFPQTPPTKCVPEEQTSSSIHATVHH